ncbi:MAG TPA: hypothetical protein PLV45_14595 [bacterium]|nr:hypothetical protein [bacterium]
MVEKNEWRLTNQEKYLKGLTLMYKTYSQYREGWDHDHCEFCWAKFTEPGTPDTLHEGYTTLDRKYWICSRCFEDFKEMFGWTVRKDLTIEEIR